MFWVFPLKSRPHVMDWKLCSYVPIQRRTQSTEINIHLRSKSERMVWFFFRTKAATSRFYLIGKISHAELREDQKVRDTGRGKALSWTASRQNQARRLRTRADWCAWNTLSALEMPKFTVDASTASVCCSFLLQEHTLEAKQPSFEPNAAYLTS